MSYRTRSNKGLWLTGTLLGVLAGCGASGEAGQDVDVQLANRSGASGLEVSADTLSQKKQKDSAEYCSWVGTVFGTGGVGLAIRTGPGVSYPAHPVRIPDGTPIDINCQNHGTSVGGNNVWDYTSYKGYWGWVSDYYVNTGCTWLGVECQD